MDSITPRQLYAALALNAFLSRGSTEVYSAKMAFQAADEMLKHDADYLMNYIEGMFDNEQD